jgi:hypothetical protein
MPAIYGNRTIENETAYANAVKRNILENARKTFVRTYPDHEEILSFVAGGRIEGDRGLSYKEGFVGSLARSFDVFGKLTEGQVNAVRKCIEQRKARRAEWADKQAALNANRQHLGVVGEKVTLTLTIKRIVIVDGFHGSTSIYICEDADRNVVIYKGRAAAFEVLNGELTKQDDVITVVAVVAAHGVREGVKQTVIQRPKAL